MFITDPGSDFFLLGSSIDKISDPDLHQRICVFVTQKNDIKFSKIRSGMFIPDPGSGYFSIPDPGVKQAPDPGSESATLEIWMGLSAKVIYEERFNMS